MSKYSGLARFLESSEALLTLRSQGARMTLNTLSTSLKEYESGSYQPALPYELEKPLCLI